MRQAIGATLVLVLVWWLCLPTATAAQPATPGAVTCDVEPRSDEDLGRLAALAATPMVGTPVGEAGALPAGAPAEPGAVTAITATLEQVAACEDAGDVGRLLALYSDRYAVEQALAPESVPIVPGTPGAVTAPVGTPPVTGGAVVVLETVVLEDGRVAALVEEDGRVTLVVFIAADDRWLIDEMRPAAADGGTPGAEAETSVPHEVAALPPVRAAVADAAAQLGVAEGELTVVAVEPTVWPDASLGCPQPDQFYAQVETPGYMVVIAVGEEELTYHTDEGDAVVPCEEDSAS